MKPPIKIAVFISGAGSNARNLIQYFQDNSLVKIVCVVSTKRNDEMKMFCQENKTLYIECLTTNEGFLLEKLEEHNISLIVLAGFLKKIGTGVLNSFRDKIINVHPALLPKYGGKGMYGEKVHQAVFENREKESGITIHLVNEEYDEGRILFQFTCEIKPEHTVQDIENNVRKLEISHFPKAINDFCESLLQ